MKKNLLLLILIVISIQINAQELSNLEKQHQKLTLEAELDRKESIATTQDVFKQDSAYFYDDFEDNLERKWLYYDHNFANNYGYYEDFSYDGSEWTLRFERTRTFNTDGSVSSYLSQKYEDGEWSNSARATYEYNQSGFTTLEDREQWNTDLQAWGPFIRFERTFDADNNLLTLAHSSKDLSGTILELRYINTYTSVDNEITEWITERYSNGEVYGTEKTEVFLNADGDRDSTYSYEWNENTSTWDLIDRFIYPEDINSPIRIYQTDVYLSDSNSWDPRFRQVYSDYSDIGEVQYWDRMRSDEGSPEFYLDSRLEYFWSSNPLDVEGLSDIEVDILMANPFEGNPQITVKGITEQTTIAIYEITGKMVFTKDLNESDSFILNNQLPNGTYILHLMQENKVVAAKKIFKMR